MKQTAVAIVLIVLFSLALAAQATKPPIYNPDADAKKEITQAMATAKAQNKHIIVMFGANWCPWCHRLHELFKSDAAIKSFLSAHYVLVMVDIGETKDKPLNRDLEEKLRVKGFGYPCLAVLDADGNLLCAQSSGVLESGKGHDPQKVLGFLKAEAPLPKK